jgi:hypothetical protein
MLVDLVVTGHTLHRDPMDGQISIWLVLICSAIPEGWKHYRLALPKSGNDLNPSSDSFPSFFPEQSIKFL